LTSRINASITSAQALSWARERADPVQDLIETLARLRGQERAARLEYGEDAHRIAYQQPMDTRLPADARWAQASSDPAANLAELHWTLAQFERAARLTYGSPPHRNALDYALARLQAAYDMAGLELLASDAF
jgi:hypothetical protein